jgi:hypothetical protein
MNMFFGEKLRRELVDLICKPDLLRHRADSTGSHRLSSESTEQTIIIPQKPSKAYKEWGDFEAEGDLSDE